MRCKEMQEDVRIMLRMLRMKGAAKRYKKLQEDVSF